MSQIIDRQSILFYKRILSSSNVILCTLLRFKQSDICDLLAKYRIPSIVITSTRSKAIDDCWAFGVLGGALTLSSTCVVFLDVSWLVLFFNVYVLPFGIINDDDDDNHPRRIYNAPATVVLKVSVRFTLFIMSECHFPLYKSD